MTVFETWKPEETYELGKKMGEEAVPGQVICLNGDLGVEMCIRDSVRNARLTRSSLSGASMDPDTSSRNTRLEAGSASSSSFLA